MKRLALVIAALFMALAFFGCSQGSTADTKTYENTVYGYKFNVEYDWTLSEEGSGSHIRYQSPMDANGVSPASFTVDVSLASVEPETFLQNVKDLYSNASSENVKLDGASALRCEYTEETGGEKRDFIVIYCVKDGYSYRMMFTVLQSDREKYIAAFENVIASFTFTGRTAQTDFSEVSYEGGKVESVNGDYSFDCPSGWGVIRRDGMIAVAPQSGNASITVTAFTLSSDKAHYGVYDYWEEYHDELASVLPGFTVTKEYKDAEPKLGGVLAARKEYSAEIDGAEYKYVQVICIYKGYVYSLLFTSDAAEYGEYSPAVDPVIDSFKFD
ncbi:MAG: hypothetical protein J5760_07275 [Clostridia bacterium]|nr:hypothetical protein [Clostridia bacterium]